MFMAVKIHIVLFRVMLS